MSFFDAKDSSKCKNWDKNIQEQKKNGDKHEQEQKNTKNCMHQLWQTIEAELQNKQKVKGKNVSVVWTGAMLWMF